MTRCPKCGDPEGHIVSGRSFGCDGNHYLARPSRSKHSILKAGRRGDPGSSIL
jgi:hypothetical protein